MGIVLLLSLIYITNTYSNTIYTIKGHTYKNVWPFLFLGFYKLYLSIMALFS